MSFVLIKVILRTIGERIKLSLVIAQEIVFTEVVIILNIFRVAIQALTLIEVVKLVQPFYGCFKGEC